MSNDSSNEDAVIAGLVWGFILLCIAAIVLPFKLLSWFGFKGFAVFLIIGLIAAYFLYGIPLGINPIGLIPQLPSLPSIPISIENSTYVIGSSNARGRECPKLSCARVVAFKAGSEIQVIGTTIGDKVADNPTWLIVRHTNSLVYVHSSLASPRLPTPAPVPELSCEPDDPAWSKQWNLRAVNWIEAVREFPDCSPSPIDIAVIDSGVMETHSDLEANIESTVTRYQDTANDTIGHGTFVSGIIGAISNDQGVVGLHPNAKLRIYKNGDLHLPLQFRRFSNTVALIRAAVDDGAKVINISTGFDDDQQMVKGVPVPCIVIGDNCQGELRLAIEYAKTKNVIIVTAAGNDGVNGGVYPAAYAATYTNVIAVAASTPDGVVADYSNTGDFVTISAPGGMEECKPDEDDCIISTWINGSVVEVPGGTSYAAPHVTGIVALMLSMNPNLTPIMIRQIITRTAKPFSSQPPRQAGLGIIDAGAAVKEAKLALQNSN